VFADVRVVIGGRPRLPMTHHPPKNALTDRIRRVLALHSPTRPSLGVKSNRRHWGDPEILLWNRMLSRSVFLAFDLHKIETELQRFVVHYSKGYSYNSQVHCLLQGTLNPKLTGTKGGLMIPEFNTWL